MPISAIRPATTRESRVQDGRLVWIQGSDTSPLVKTGERQIQVRRASGPSPVLWVTFGADGRVEFIHTGTRAVRRMPAS